MNEQLLDRILRVIACGSVVLAVSACGDRDYAPANSEPSKSESNGTAGTATSNATTSNTTTSNLPTISASMLECVGESNHFLGPCCPKVECYEASEGETCTLPNDDNRYELASNLGPEYQGLGSGLCLCAGPDGPFDPSSSHLHTEDTGDCCYIITTQSCSGRPLTCGDGEIRTAGVVERSDWV